MVLLWPVGLVSGSVTGLQQIPVSGSLPLSGSYDVWEGSLSPSFGLSQMVRWGNGISMPSASIADFIFQSMVVLMSHHTSDGAQMRVLIITPSEAS